MKKQTLDIPKNENLSQMDGEIQCEKLVQELQKMGISPPDFFKHILKRIIQDEANKRTLRRWFDQEILQRGKET